MDLGLTGKSAIITGGSRGIGLAIAKAFAQEGANVSICARSEGPLSSARASLDTYGTTVHSLPCDVSDPVALHDYIQAAHHALGGLNVLVNNPSGFGRTDDEAGWKMSIDIDLMASVRGCWSAIPLIEKSGGGAIIHISSISGLTQSQRTPPYGAVKAALNQYTMTQALELAPKSIRVNAIAPGSIYFEGGLWHQAQTNNPELYENILAGIPRGRYGTPEEVASVAVFLASEPGQWVTGQTIAVDGGQML
ncbi:MAG: SDR family NAD(P)-dependent oxidoreductase [Arenicellales bacterium]|jgi:3-oxoacyl-[acyl-carrier protein] reductase|tara:strand:- start:653 stop:1402 length:750 start_codon:yes stop_codon:yes gene_type:complete